MEEVLQLLGQTSDTVPDKLANLGSGSADQNSWEVVGVLREVLGASFGPPGTGEYWEVSNGQTLIRSPEQLDGRKPTRCEAFRHNPTAGRDLRRLYGRVLRV